MIGEDTVPVGERKLADDADDDVGAFCSLVLSVMPRNDTITMQPLNMESPTVHLLVMLRFWVRIARSRSPSRQVPYAILS